MQLVWEGCSEPASMHLTRGRGVGTSRPFDLATIHPPREAQKKGPACAGLVPPRRFYGKVAVCAGLHSETRFNEGETNHAICTR
jgi:hypothetical protein